MPPWVCIVCNTFSDSSKSLITECIVVISNTTPISLALNSGSSNVPFITISVCKSFVLNAFIISIGFVLYITYPLLFISFLCHFYIVFIKGLRQGNQRFPFNPPLILNSEMSAKLTCDPYNELLGFTGVRGKTWFPFFLLFIFLFLEREP